MVRTSQNSLEAYRYIDCGANTTYRHGAGFQGTLPPPPRHSPALSGRTTRQEEEVEEKEVHTPRWDQQLLFSATADLGADD